MTDIETNDKSLAGTPKTPPVRKAWEFWRRNNVILLQLPLMIAFLFGSYILLRSIDSRIGVEGFGDIFGYALNGVRITFILFTAFWMKKWMLFDLHDKTEYELFESMKSGNWMAFWIVVRDRVEWFVVLSLATYWYTR